MDKAICKCGKSVPLEFGFFASHREPEGAICPHSGTFAESQEERRHFSCHCGALVLNVPGGFHCPVCGAPLKPLSSDEAHVVDRALAEIVLGRKEG